MTISDRMVATGGRSTGFDYLRLILATGVIIWHAFPLSYGPGTADQFMTSPWRPLAACLVPMFFALSGFLVAGSLERNKVIWTFLGLRGIRIVPALLMEVMLSALILGPLLTTVPLREYFTSPLFSHYLLNVFGLIHYQLPGLFASVPYPNVVNGQIWSVPWEMKCYLALTILSFARIVKTRFLFAGSVALSNVVLWAYSVHVGGDALDAAHGVTGYALIFCFLAGTSFYNLKDLVPWNGWLALLATGIAIGLFLIPSGDYLIGFPIAYVTMYLGLLNPKKLSALQGDYSYGLYIYGFAVQQGIASMGEFTHHWYVNLALSYPIALAFAVLSWVYVEKPALMLRDYLPDGKRAIRLRPMLKHA